MVLIGEVEFGEVLYTVWPVLHRASLVQHPLFADVTTVGGVGVVPGKQGLALLGPFIYPASVRGFGGHTETDMIDKCRSCHPPICVPYVRRNISFHSARCHRDLDS